MEKTTFTLLFFKIIKLNEIDHVLDSEESILPVCRNRCYNNKTNRKKNSRTGGGITITSKNLDQHQCLSY